MTEGTQLSARAVASLLAQIFGPSYYDLPVFGRGDVRRSDVDLGDLVSAPHPQPWRWVMLNPQPLPPRELFALTLADAHIHSVLTLDRASLLLEGGPQERALDRARRIVAELEQTLPRWPRWPRSWPPPPPPPWEGEEMRPAELLVYGSRFLAAAEVAEQEGIRATMALLGERAMTIATQG